MLKRLAKYLAERKSNSLDVVCVVLIVLALRDHQYLIACVFLLTLCPLSVLLEAYANR